MTFSKNTASELKSEVLKKLSNLKDEKINKSQLFQKIEALKYVQWIHSALMY